MVKSILKAIGYAILCILMPVILIGLLMLCGIACPIIGILMLILLPIVIIGIIIGYRDGSKKKGH